MLSKPFWLTHNPSAKRVASAEIYQCFLHKKCNADRGCIFNSNNKLDYSEVLPAAFALAHRALAAAAILARPSALIVDFFFAGLAPFAFAQRAFCAAEILARAAALILDLFFGAGAGVEGEEPKMALSSFSKAVILSLRSAARFSCAEVSDDRLLMVQPV